MADLVVVVPPVNHTAESCGNRRMSRNPQDLVLDVLSHGQDWMRIAYFAAAAFGCGIDDLTTKYDGRTVSLKAAIETIYKDGRSQLAHGTTFGLLQDQTELRGMAQYLTHALMRICAKPMEALLAKEPAADIKRLMETFEQAN